ncbi:hypothetical protein ACP8HI_08490 [Paenibacillus sp. FA6]|uniref:hypothetical protein n=1 Tax=Paenibacillus sp. FA6 TaxID=3413029 RepID=UPI003F65B115
MRILLICILTVVLTSCSYNDIDYDEVTKAELYAEKLMVKKGVTAVSSSQSNEYIKFRIMTKDTMNNEEAKKIVGEFIDSFESQIKNKEKFRKIYDITFDIKSEKNGNILFNGKRDKGKGELWWQF